MYLEKIVLDLPKETKEQFLRESIQEGKIDVFLRLQKILLSVPLVQGGLETDHLSRIFKDEMDKKAN
jgi:hypothetical protein|tara:strand:- start:852 stop:1052 length:201 start_codon:yes stop_codon:yes gene_type:complete